MRKLLLATIALNALTGAAFAADLPSRKEAPVYLAPAPAFSWTGFYGGVYGGGVFGSVSVHEPIGNGHNNQSPNGGTVGGLVGYTYQFSPNFVVGVEGDGGWQGYRSSSNFISASNGRPITQTVDTDYAARIRGRLGYAVNNVLLFVAGGASFSDVKLTEIGNGGVSGPYSITRNFAGWNVGGGLDYGFAPNWVGRIEYVYDGYGSKNYGFRSLPLVGANFFNDRTVRPEESTVRAALIYKFGAPEPVVAKY